MTLADLIGALEPPQDLPEPQRHALDVALLRVLPAGRSSDRPTVSVATLGLVRALATGGPVVIAIDEAWEAGEALTADEAIARALDSLE